MGLREATPSQPLLRCWPASWAAMGEVHSRQLKSEANVKPLLCSGTTDPELGNSGVRWPRGPHGRGPGILTPPESCPGAAQSLFHLV